jgi:hypothetical protein
MGIAEIESAIAQLPAKDFSELIAWLKRHYDLMWDQQIEDDLAAGRLDSLIVEADDEYRQELAKPL